MTPGAGHKLFDRKVAGTELVPVRVDVDARAVRSFAEALGCSETGEASGQLVALPTFFTFIDAEADRARTREGEQTILQFIGCDERYLLHGEEDYELVAPIHSGDQLTIRARIVGFRDSKDGRLEFADIEQTAECDRRGLLVRARRTYIHRMPS